MEENNYENTKKKAIDIEAKDIYLKDKIGKMEFNNNVLYGINKGIGEILKSVKKI